MATLTDHINRAERSTDEQQRNALLAVAADLLPYWSNTVQGRKFYALMDAGGHLSAAMILLGQLQPNKHIAVGTRPDGGWSASVGEWTDRLYGQAQTPALALLAAVLRALEQEQGKEAHAN